jgi:hypothetical protein
MKYLLGERIFNRNLYLKSSDQKFMRGFTYFAWFLDILATEIVMRQYGNPSPTKKEIEEKIKNRLPGCIKSEKWEEKYPFIVPVKAEFLEAIQNYRSFIPEGIKYSFRKNCLRGDLKYYPVEVDSTHLIDENVSRENGEIWLNAGNFLATAFYWNCISYGVDRIPIGLYDLKAKDQLIYRFFISHQIRDKFVIPVNFIEERMSYKNKNKAETRESLTESLERLKNGKFIESFELKKYKKGIYNFEIEK